MLQIKNISKSFSGKSIIKDVSYLFPSHKRIALIGVNGAGKTTLLNIVCGLEEQDSGDIIISKDDKIGYLPQSPNANPEDTILLECMSGDKALFNLKLQLEEASAALEQEYSQEIYDKYEKSEHDYQYAGGYKLEANAEKILLGLGFKREQLSLNPKTLSGGWSMRLELGKVLLQSPDFLILDEPTNHLDLPSIIWLEEYLQKFKGTLLFISHDEELLNKLSNIILHLKDGVVREYHGNYDSFLVQYEERQAAAVSELKTKEKKIAQLSKFVDRFGAKASKAAQAQSKMKMIAAIERQTSNISVDSSDLEMHIPMKVTQKSGEDVLHLQGCTIGYDKPLLSKINMYVGRGYKVAILGTNGKGKTTMLKSINGQLKLLEGDIKVGHNVKVGYYAQEQLELLDPKLNVLENLMRANTKLIEREARKILGSFLFSSDAVFKPVAVLSGGEKSRLSLACLLMEEANLLLLDEPTNHLDMLSTNILSEALSNYEGTVMFVSHNRRFINDVATHIFSVDDMTLRTVS